MNIWRWFFPKADGDKRQAEQKALSIDSVVRRELRVLEDVKRTNLEAHDKLNDLILEMRRRHLP